MNDYYNKIKDELINNEIIKKVKTYSINKNNLTTYYNVGKLLSEAGKHYGEGIIKKYSIKLSEDIGKKYSYRSLNYMIKFYNYQKMQSVTANLSWGHWIELLSIDDSNKINYYVNKTINMSLTTKKLRQIIKEKEYERLPIKYKSSNKENTTINDIIPNPIIIKSDLKYIKITEKILQNIIVEKISSFLKELGKGFTYIDNEYQIKIGNNYNYIDLLLFNIEYNCYVVVELKVNELKKEHIGQIEIYMNYIDKNIKKHIHNKTIGIIIVKKDNKYILEYCSNKNIMSRRYIIIS